MKDTKCWFALLPGLLSRTEVADSTLCGVEDLMQGILLENVATFVFQYVWI